jgi:hypothetical protein
MAEQGPQRQEPNRAGLSRLSRTASFWVLLILLPILMLTLMRGQEEPRSTFDTSEFNRQVAWKERGLDPGRRGEERAGLPPLQ